jgi:hypothetical protein
METNGPEDEVRALSIGQKGELEVLSTEQD